MSCGEARAVLKCLCVCARAGFLDTDLFSGDETTTRAFEVVAFALGIALALVFPLAAICCAPLLFFAADRATTFGTGPFEKPGIGQVVEYVNGSSPLAMRGEGAQREEAAEPRYAGATMAKGSALELT